MKIAGKGEVTFTRDYSKKDCMEAQFFSSSVGTNIEDLEKLALPEARRYVKNHRMEVEIVSDVEVVPSDSRNSYLNKTSRAVG